MALRECFLFEVMCQCDVIESTAHRCPRADVRLIKRNEMTINLTCLDFLTAYDRQLKTQPVLRRSGLLARVCFNSLRYLCQKKLINENDEELSPVQQDRSLNKRPRRLIEKIR